MSYRNFESDLKIGLGLESEITSRLSQVTEVENSQEYNPDFDIVLTQLGITLEVKLDEASNRYQNYCIETTYEGRPSGINSTKADVWIQGNNDGLLILNRLSLLELVSDMKTIRRDIQGKDVEMCLVPKTSLRMHGTMVTAEDNAKELLYTIIEESDN
tara:strand:- start:298 stop:771 length:474 start_codon:yes stop_codon:yes gene_type:complete